MRSRWLIFLSFGTIGAIVFVFFVLRLQPVKPHLNTADSVAPGSIASPTVTFVNPWKGNPSPKVTIVEFSDFQCPACKQIDDSLNAVLRAFPNDVKLVWKDMPNESAHPLSTLAAIAAHCADHQGKFWEYHDALFSEQAYLAEDQFSPIAQTVGLDVPTFETCYQTRDTLPIVKKDFDEGVGLGIVATPTVYINGTSYVGALSTEQLTTYVQQAMAGQQ